MKSYEEILLKKKDTRKRKKKQLRINNQLKKSLYKDIVINPCCYCKNVFLLSDLTIEHIIPLSYGGTNDHSNIDLACAPCNNTRGRLSWINKRNLLKEKYE